MNHRCLATQLGIFHRKESWAFLCSPQEVKVQADSVGLFLGRKSGLEVRTGYLEKYRSYVATMRDFEMLVIFSNSFATCVIGWIAKAFSATIEPFLATLENVY